VGDPQLLAVEDILVALQLRLGLQREGIRTGTGFAQRVGAHGVAAQARQIALLLLFRGPAQESVVDQRILHIHDNSGGRIDAGKFLHRENRLEESTAASAVLLGNFNAHQTQLKELFDELVLEDTLLVHLLDVGPDAFVRELADRVAEQYFVFGKRNQRGGCGGGELCNGFGQKGNPSGWSRTFDFGIREERDCERKVAHDSVAKLQPNWGRRSMVSLFAGQTLEIGFHRSVADQRKTTLAAGRRERKSNGRVSLVELRPQWERRLTAERLAIQPPGRLNNVPQSPPTRTRGA